MLLKNNFQDNRILAVSSQPSHRCNQSCDVVVGSKTTGLPKYYLNDKTCTISSLSGFLRCYVEDFMSLDVNDRIVLLIPTSNTHRKYDHCIEVLCPPVVCFGDGSSNSVNSMYYIFDNCTIATTLYKERVKNGLSISELTDGLGTHNFGLTIRTETNIANKIEDVFANRLQY